MSLPGNFSRCASKELREGEQAQWILCESSLKPGPAKCVPGWQTHNGHAVLMRWRGRLSSDGTSGCKDVCCIVPPESTKRQREIRLDEVPRGIRRRLRVACGDNDNAHTAALSRSCLAPKGIQVAPFRGTVAVMFELIGSGHHVPGEPIKNADLARVMDTSDDWIFQRSGIRQRHFCPEGLGASDLAVPAAEKAIADAGIDKSEIDYVIFATMTPDYLLPGAGATFSAKLGIPGVPTLDIRQQCAAMVFSMQLIDGLIQSGAAKTILLVGAEAHAGFMPWQDWDILMGEREGPPSPEALAAANEHRGISILFGDGAGALIFRKTERDAGLVSAKIHSDGRAAELLYVPGGGFRTRPYWKPDMYTQQSYVPRMDGRELFKFAVTKLPKCARDLCKQANVSLEQVDYFLAHQANLRINEYIRGQLGAPDHKMPMNIDRFGNTSAATIPILIDEERRKGTLQAGQLNMMLALGAGLHWGCCLIRW
jgi:3-oxoacyl-[acyl-carrier-protein] synthase III